MLIKSLLTLLFISAPVLLSAQTFGDAQKAYDAAVIASNDSNYAETINQFNICLDVCDKLISGKKDEKAYELKVAVQKVLPVSYLLLGQDQIKNKKLNEGLSNFYKALELAQKFENLNIEERAKKIIPQVHYSLAAKYLKENKPDEAISECDKAIAIDTNFINAYYLKIVALNQKDDDAAFKSAALISIAACKRLGDQINEQKMVDFSHKYFLKKAINAKGISKIDEAINFLNSALEFYPNDAIAYYLLASIYNAQGKYSEAISAGQKSVEFETGGDVAKAKVYMIIAEANAKNGDNTAACTAYKKAAFGQYAESANYQIEQVLKCK
jgi:tetratricopeptide (TPR) repeat protein